MSLRWRARGGDLLCGAKSEPEADDSYIDDNLHYQLSMTGAIAPEEDEPTSGRWRWIQHEPYYIERPPK